MKEIPYNKEIEPTSDANQTNLNGWLVSFSCNPCERGNHIQCIEKNLRKGGFITGTSAHCICFYNGHRKGSKV